MFERNKWYKATNVENLPYYIKVIDFELRNAYKNQYQYHMIYYQEFIRNGEYKKLDYRSYWANKDMENSALENIVTSQELFDFLPKSIQIK